MASFLRKTWSRRDSGWFRYSLPFLTVVLAIILQFVLEQFIGKKTSFPFAFLYLLAVFATAWLGGYVPGVLAAIITMVGLPLMVVPVFRLGSLEWIKIATFAGVSLLVSGVADAQRRMRRDLATRNEELDRRVEARTKELARAVAQLELEVDQRRKTEIALRRSEQRVDITLADAGIGRWDLDLATGSVSRSLRYDQIFGYAALQPEWTLETFHNHLAPEDRAAVEQAERAALDGGEALDFDVRIVRADGETRWVWIHGAILWGAEGTPVSILGSIQDIHEAKVAGHKLRTQLERLKLLDQITRGIGERQDLRSIFQVAIRSVEESLPVDFGCICLHDPATGSVKVTCVGVKSEDLAHELAMTERANIDINQNGLSRCLRGELVYEADVAKVDYPFPRRMALGGMRSLVAAPLLMENQVFGVMIAARREAHSFESSDCEFLRQLSEHVALAANQAQIRDALQQAYDDLRRSQQAVMQQERLRALGQMASGIAHDINNAISPVALFTESLLENEPNLSPRARRYLETTQTAIEDVAATVARMREFYRQPETQLTLTPVHAGHLARQVLDLTQARWSDMAQRRGVTIQGVADLDPALPAIAGIESEIREALTNLVLNAADAMPNGGTLTVRTRLAHDEDKAPLVHLEVCDTGVGMDEATRRQCLEPFFTTKGERGTGLGLAMVYGIAQRHNAAIEIESAPGKGTTARLVFPVPAAMASEPEARASRPSSLRLRILVVDDDPLLIKSLRDTLEAEGHEVTTASGGSEGISIFETAAAERATFSAVITDLGMPNVDGRKVARAIKAVSPDTPVILLTGWGQRLAAEGDTPPDVDRVLSKPPKLRILRAALAELSAEPTVVASGR